MQRRRVIGVFLIALLIAGALYTYNRRAKKNRATDYFNIANEHQRHGRLPEAINSMKRAIADDPRYFYARQGLADLYLLDSRSKEAIQVLEEGVQVAPQDTAKYHFELGRAYTEIQEYASAKDYFEKCVLAEPNSPIHRRMLGSVLEKMKRWAEAEKVWREFAQQFPNDISGPRGVERVRRKMNVAQPPQLAGTEKENERP